jgi:hypothetical protein
VESRADAIAEAAARALERTTEPGRPELWDGRTAVRIVDALLE